MDSSRCRCEVCLRAKSYGQVSHRDKRPNVHKVQNWLEQVDCDYKGPFPVSLMGNVLAFSMMDSSTGWVECYSVRNKDDVGRILK